MIRLAHRRALTVPRILTTLTIFTLQSACAPRSAPEIQWRAFDGQRAFAHVERLVGYGPRPSGSPALVRAANYINTQLQEFGLDVQEQVFSVSTPRGPLEFRNIIGRTRAGRGGPDSVIVLGSHYDTKWMTNITMVGANDGGSSAGVLLEMARVAARQPNLWFVFFDGEEAVMEYGASDGLFGSRFFVENLKTKNQLGWIKAMVLLDMVGDANLNITLPANSSPALVQQLFDAARATAHRDYFSARGMVMVDDHVPFLGAGIPAIDIIDFEYGSAPGLNDYWHTELDTLDKLSSHSLEVAGQTTLQLLSQVRKSSSVR
jgi:glutaminyl-peptide cyclotransferase